jgi:cell surface protein SprA
LLTTNLVSLKRYYVFICILLLLFLKGSVSAQVNVGSKTISDTALINKQKDSLRYAIKDRRGDFLSQPSNNPFDLRDPNLIKRNIEYDPATKQYFIREFVNGRSTKVPTGLSFNDFWKLKSDKDEKAYFSYRANSLGVLNRKVSRPKAKVFDSYFDRLFGKTGSDLKLDFKPVGEINIKAGYQGQTVMNPTLPERARSNGGFDFDASTNFSMNASIGDKLKFPVNFNTLSNLGFDNQIKLNYKGKKDEIIKSIEAGNINYISRSALIPSTQNLFGIKTQMQFGRLFVTAAIANQKSQRQSMNLQGGAATQKFQKRLDDYEENRHFLLAQYFRNNYNKAMSSLPLINSQVQIKRIEVWVTNRNGQTTNSRDVVGLADLGEPQPSNAKWQGSANPYPDNSANNLYATLSNNPAARNSAGIASILTAEGMRSAQDYERTFARKLTQNEYFFNPQIGFLSLNIPLQPDEVLGVAFQYTYNGKLYQVGEFSDNVALNPDNGVQQIMFLKLLKATTQRTDLPIWDLMMKNVYSLDLFGSIQQQDFQLNVLYEAPSAGLKRYMPVTSKAVEGQSLLKILQLDRLNNQNDPQPDGLFDYVEGYTVLSNMGRIVFPLLEPFGEDLKNIAFKGVDSATTSKYIFPQLYRKIKAEAQTYNNLDRFVMEGQVKGSSGGAEISLNAFNVPPGSVTVRAGGQILKEGMDYIVDYGSGTVRIINPGILSSNIPVNVSFENNIGFGFQERGFRALRLDYVASKDFNFGFSTQRLSERPFFTKTNFGSDPIKNAMYGFDFNYRSELPSVTNFLNKLPFYKTKAKSYITANGEAAYLQPGHAQQIGKGGAGLVYLDDFEATRTDIDLRFPFTAWALASTPMDKFTEGNLSNNIDYNKNRARIAWYTIEPTLQDPNSPNNPMNNNKALISDPRVRQVFTNELFPNKTTNLTDVQLPTFDLTYYPKDRGPYNYNYKDLDNAGKHKNPIDKWGGIMRALDQTDFETSIIEYVEFWVQDPFIKSPASKGKLVLNLGNVSEDILRDGRRFYENGMPTPTIPAQIDSSVWGKVPINPIQVTNAFSNNAEDRKFQDVGIDGMNDDEEKIKRADVIGQITNAVVAQQFTKDPSADNYVWYRDAQYDAAGAGILSRYKYFNNPQGNSAIAGTSQFSSASTLLPDNEDLNRDNTLNESEAYFEYEIPMQKNSMGVGVTKYVTDSKTVTVNLADGSKSIENWYLFRVPVKSYSNVVGGIKDFKSIRFVRMYMTGFEDSITLRFAKLSLVRNQWRQYMYDVDSTGYYTPLPASNTLVNTLAVSIEENGSRAPVNYIIPPGIERVQLLSNNGVNLLQNEQSLSVQIRNFEKGKSPRGVFKTMNVDIRRYGKLSMFLHAENKSNITQVEKGAITAVIRIGQDFQNNYYEVRIPLTTTKQKIYSNVESNLVWPLENELNLSLIDLVNLKLERDKQNYSFTSKFSKQQPGAYPNNIQTYSVMGNPNLGEVRGVLISFENTSSQQQIDAEMWINEMRLSNLDESGSWAALGRMDLVMADLGTIAVSVNNRTAGFGTIEQNMNQRAKTGLTQVDVATNIDAGKLLPKQTRLSLPVFASINKSIEAPLFDPFDKDVLYQDKLNNLSGAKKDSVRNASTDQTTIKTLNFTNVRFMPGQKTSLISLSNLDFSYSYSQLVQTSPLIEANKLTKQRGAFGYTYNNNGKSIEPFRKILKNASPWFAWARDFNVNPSPSLISFRTVLDRQYGEFTPRVVSSYDGTTEKVETTYNKYFTMVRLFNLRWPLSRSLNLDFNATMNSRIDEPDGPINTQAKRDSINRMLLGGGRNTLYNQRFSLRYDLPTSKFPLTNWINSSYNFATNYNWIGASRLAQTLGNTIENTMSQQISAQFNFLSFYSKSKYINAALNNNYNSGRQNLSNPLETKLLMTKEEALAGKVGKERVAALKKWKEDKRNEKIAQRILKQNEPINVPSSVKSIARFLTMMQTANIDYAENFNSRLPGFMTGVQFVDKSFTGLSPNIDYMFGRQPDTAWLNGQEKKGNLTKDPAFNMLFRQTFDQKLSARIMLEPVKSLIIDVNLNKTFSKEYSELYKDTSYNFSGTKTHANPFSAGGFNISYMALNTFFETHDPNVISLQFKAFQNYRTIISQRLGVGNVDASGYKLGYGRYAQDVLIPAFIAAYTGQDPKKVSLINQNNGNIRANPFGGMLPKPNWNIMYTGLSKLPGLSEYFTNITLTNGYNGSLAMNSFTSSLNFADDPMRRGTPTFLDPISKNYIPYFLIPNVTISERMEPLIGINVTTVNQWSMRFEYKKSRMLSLSLVDYQLSENNSKEWVLGASWRKKGLRLPFKIPGLSNSKLSNDMTFRFDMSMRDVYNSNSRLDQTNAYGTGGQKEITLQPSIDYVLNSKINLRFFFDQRRATPYISSSPPIVNTRAGVNVRIAL